MPSATRPSATNICAKLTAQALVASGSRLEPSTSAAAEDRSPGLQVVGGQDEQSLGRLLERGEGGLGQLQRALVVSLLRLGAGESHAGGGVRRVQLQDPPEEGKGQLGLALERVDLREVEMGPDEAWLEPDGLLEQLGAFPEPVLLNADDTEHGPGRGSRLGIGERQLGLLVGFLEPPFLGQDRRSLEGLARLGHRNRPRARERRTAGGRRRPEALPSRRPEGLRGGSHVVLGTPRRHGYTLYQ